MVDFICWIIVILGVWYGFSRLVEELKRQKTLRRMDDIGNMYYDYNHNIWVNKIAPEVTPAKENENV